MEITRGLLIGCRECGTCKVPVMRLGEPFFEGSATTWLCKDCLKKALALMEERAIPEGGPS